MEDRRLFSIFGRRVRIYLLTEDKDFARTVQDLWSPEDVYWEVFDSGKLLLECLFTDPPHMLICSETSLDMSGIDVVRMVKAENVFRQVCAVLCLAKSSLAKGFDWSGIEVDDFLLLPLSEVELRARIELALRRSTRTLDANPLTRLPGNTSIMQIVEQYLSEGMEFAVGYLDIDNFKSFNDKYGFSRGDEALLMTARLLVSTVMNVDEEPKFVGHIGGDDFFFILPVEHGEAACQSMIESYDAIIPSFYDNDDRSRGAILSTDRQGIIHNFSLMSISIALAYNRAGRFSHFGEMSQCLGQVKMLAKAKAGSCYVVDRRRS